MHRFVFSAYLADMADAAHNPDRLQPLSLRVPTAHLEAAHAFAAQLAAANGVRVTPSAAAAAIFAAGLAALGLLPKKGKASRPKRTARKARP